MSVNKFGQYSGGAKALRGPKGEGFSLTDDGHYDMQNKLLRNVARPEADLDAVNRKYLAIHTPYPTNSFWDFKDRRLVRVKEPRDLTDGVNKKYMEDCINNKIDPLTADIVKKAELDSKLSPITKDISELKSKQTVDVIARDEFARKLKSFGVHLFRHIHKYVPQGRTAQPSAYDENNYLNWNEILEVNSLTKDGEQKV